MPGRGVERPTLRCLAMVVTVSTSRSVSRPSRTMRIAHECPFSAGAPIDVRAGMPSSSAVQVLVLMAIARKNRSRLQPIASNSASQSSSGMHRGRRRQARVVAKLLLLRVILPTPHLTLLGQHRGGDAGASSSR